MSEFKHRRELLLSRLNKKALVILFSSPEPLRNGDVYYPYRQNSDFYYLTGFPESEAVALLNADSAGNFILFSRARDDARSIWTGQWIGQENACKLYGADEAYSIDQLETTLKDYLAHYTVCYYLGESPLDRKLLKRINGVLESIHKPPLCTSQELLFQLHEMRLIKSSLELNCLRAAARLSGQAHIRAMKACLPGQYEYQLEAELIYEFYQAGHRATAYPSIVAGGANACILHYTANRSLLKSGDLVLIDAGCEYQYYAADITRTFPVNGHFSLEQAALYTIVLKAQQELIAMIKPSISWNALQKTCISLLTQGLIEIGLLKGELSELIEQEAYKKFYMHQCSHWVGLNVHDPSHYKLNKKWRCLEPNMVLTVEPGLYIVPSEDVEERWWNIGIRIEDTIRVTTDACEVLTQGVPKTISDIEVLMQSS